MGSLDLHLWNTPLFRVGEAFQEPTLGTLAGLGEGESFGTHILGWNGEPFRSQHLGTRMLILGWEGVDPLGASPRVLHSELR